MKVDLLVITAHPDDAELCCGGTIIAHTSAGKSVGIVDLTQGELGTRGTAKIRLKEAEEAGKIMGISFRENLGFADGFFKNDDAHRLKVMQQVRRFQPEIVISNAPHDRHPDHGRASDLVSEACFLSGLRRIETEWEGEPQREWRPARMYKFVQFNYIEPDIIVDISAHLDKKLEAIRAFKSQFHDPASKEPDTILTSRHFLEQIKARNLDWGFRIGAYAGEGFIADQKLAVRSLFDLA
ncbi:MAG: bacillithiol biosynthesis deacetylase BshB1 [Bacteroidia bacterium]